MNKLHIADALIYLFVSGKWVKRLLALIALMFLPVVGWLAIVGYFGKIALSWAKGEYDKLPTFSGFGGLITVGLFIVLTLIIYSLPAFFVSFVPWVGKVISFAYILILTIISPYLISVIAIDGTLSEKIFDFRQISAFVQENLRNLILYFVVLVALKIVACILLSPLVAAGILSIIFQKQLSGLAWFPIVPIALGIVVFLLLSFWTASVLFALCGNIYGIWLSEKGIGTVEKKL